MPTESQLRNRPIHRIEKISNLIKVQNVLTEIIVKKPHHELLKMKVTELDDLTVKYLNIIATL